jgi:acyl carrier protein
VSEEGAIPSYTSTIELIKEGIVSITDGIVQYDELVDTTALWLSEDSPDTGLEFDSLDVLELLLYLEELGCPIPSDVGPDQVETIADLANAVCEAMVPSRFQTGT